MYHKETVQGEERDEWDQLLSRRKFLKISIGAGVGLAAGSVGAFGYSLARIGKNLREVEKEYPKPSTYEYENAVMEVERHNQREILYHQCKEITDEPKTCEVFRPKIIKELHHAQSIITKQNTYEMERDKQAIPWIVPASVSTGFTLGGISRSIVSGFQLRRVNREIRELEEENNPS